MVTKGRGTGGKDAKEGEEFGEEDERKKGGAG